MARETYGLLEAAIRCRGWLPRLRHDGQRLVLCALVMFSDKRGVSDPSAGQVGRMIGRSEVTVRRIFHELRSDCERKACAISHVGVIHAVGRRTTFTTGGNPKGGFVYQWAISPIPGDHVDEQLEPVDRESQVITKAGPGDHETPPTRSSRRSVSESEYLNNSSNQKSIYQQLENLRKQGLTWNEAFNEINSETSTTSSMDKAVANLAVAFDFEELT